MVCRSVILSLFLVHTSLCIYSQRTDFYDTLSAIPGNSYTEKSFMENGFVYVSGFSFYDSTAGFTQVPTVSKIDIAGNTVWTATDHYNNSRFINHSATAYRTFKKNTQLFTVIGVRDNDTPRFSTPDEIWSIDDATGSLLWKIPLPNSRVQELTNYDDTSIIAISVALRGADNVYSYNLINKLTGKIIYTTIIETRVYEFLDRYLDIYVDDHKNILINFADTCKKYRGGRLEQLLWKSSYYSAYRTFATIDNRFITQDSGRYIFMGDNYVRSVDTATGITVWVQEVQVGLLLNPYLQSGSWDCVASNFVLTDSLLYVIWESKVSGDAVELRRGFALTQFNKNSGNINFNVAYDFNGIPADPVPNYNDSWDFPQELCVDQNRNVYITGAYDGDLDLGTWGIMKIDGKTGGKIYESTITMDSSSRSSNVMWQAARSINYYNGKMYCAGNVPKIAGSYQMKSLLVSFDTSVTYSERYRKVLMSSFRYPSSLEGLAAFGNQKVLLFKKVGRSGILEMRNQSNALLWSIKYSRANKFIVPQNVVRLADKSIAASMILYAEMDAIKLEKGSPDSLIFVKLDSAGNSIFRHSIVLNPADSIRPSGIYEDILGRVNFIFNRKRLDLNAVLYSAYMLGATPTKLGVVNGFFGSYANLPGVRLTCLQHYKGDTAITYVANAANLISPIQRLSDGSYPSYVYQAIPNFGKVYSVVKLDSASYFVTGSSLTGKITGRKYTHSNNNPVLSWQQEFAFGGSMYNADTSRSSIYCISEKSDGNMLISRINKSTGSVIWNFQRVLDPGIKMLPLTFKFNQIKNSFNVVGLTTDSNYGGSRNSYFYIELDSMGNIIRDINESGFGGDETSIKDITVLQNGISLYGGAINQGILGTVGFYNFSNLLSSPCSNNSYNYWIGAIDHNWENPGNWSCGRVPDLTTRVVINTGTIVLNSSVTIYSLIMMPGVNLSVTPGSILTILH